MDHYPVLLSETLEMLRLRADSVVCDTTSGLSGHTIAMAKVLETGWVLSCDRDGESLALGKARAEAAGVADRIRYRRTRFSGLKDALAAEGLTQVDAMVSDLGVSRYQLTDPARGFSFQHEAGIDMRMDRESEGLTAHDIVNYWSEKELADLIYQLGDERRSRQIAKAVVRGRPYHSAKALADVIAGAIPRTANLHPATRTFMALRMAVNEEIEELDALLAVAPGLIKPGGRWAVITFHSGEDARCKRALQSLAKAGKAVLLNKHVITPGEGELRENAASRSAKLRGIEIRQEEGTQ